MQTLFVVSHTHWDREWYEPFQIFRLRLCKCVDQLIDLFATDPAYKYFLLDGQTIVLEDYLEVRPQNENILRDLITRGKLTVGPWYVLPDEFLVSGEAIVRNLQRGTRIAKQFGGGMPMGYIPDPFGHISQMPQILRGFGFEAAVFRRGLADEPTELWWQASDGSLVLACYLRDSYDNAAWLEHDGARFTQGILKLRDSLAPHVATQNFLLMNGTDHMEPWRDLSPLLATARENIHDADLIHASLPMYVERVQSQIACEQIELQTVVGELRNPKRHHLLPGVLSMRMWIKQRNARAQTLLEKWAEPFSAFSQSPISNLELLHLAWKYLLQNHPHDSICGCSVDATHADMLPRFDWVEQIANTLVNENLAAIAAQIDTSTMSDAIPVIVFNSTASVRTDLVTTSIDFLENYESFMLLDDAGEELPCELVAPNMIEFIARDVPGHGYQTLQIVRRKSQLVIASRDLENEFFKIEINRGDGTLTIIDKITCAIYRGMNRFVDGGDRGDLYNYCAPENDLRVTQPLEYPQISIERTAVRQSIRIRMVYKLPMQLAFDRSSRARELVDEIIETRVSIYPGVRRIDFETTIDNRARDHLLRVEFPTDLIAQVASADQAFDVVTRSLDLPRDTQDWIEQPRPEAPMQSFVSISDGACGLTLATRGLPEYEARKEKKGTTLALTLLRCVGWLSRDDINVRRGHAGPPMETPGAQELGLHKFEYALIPHSGDWRNAFVSALEFVAPMRAVTTQAHNGSLHKTQGFAQASHREFVISAIKLAEQGDGLIVRGYNISEQVVDVTITLWRKFSRAVRVNLNEEEIAPLELIDGFEARSSVRAKEIVTIKFVE